MLYSYNSIGAYIERVLIIKLHGYEFRILVTPLVLIEYGVYTIKDNIEFSLSLDIYNGLIGSLHNM